MDEPGKVNHRPVKHIVPSPSTYTERGWERFYRCYYVQRFPVGDLGYGSNRPLWREELRHEYPWRSALYEDMRDRGQINPCIVWAHENIGYPGPPIWENYVKVGRNKCWVARLLGWDTVKAILVLSKGAEVPYEEAIPVTPENAVEVCWRDGELRFLLPGLISRGCADPAKLEAPRG